VDEYVLRDAPGWTWKANGRDNEGRFDFLVSEVPFGAGPDLHVHATQEDTFYVIDGVLTVQLGDKIVELGHGDFGTAPPGVPHSFTNTRADRVCKAINLMTPGIGFDRYIGQIDKVAATGDQRALNRLHAQYGVTVVGPSVAERLGIS
jgi:mannose-6-phosphate isomerase-like protein (cupin superfamily)